MAPTGMVLWIAIGVVAFFVLAFSLTILVKGHYIDSEIGTNRHMKQRGIRCTAAQFREEERALRGGTNPPGADCASCADCAAPCDTPPVPGEKPSAARD